MTLLAITRHNGLRIAEVGYLLLIVAGVWYVAAQVPRVFRFAAARRAVAGVALALAGVLLIVASHWGAYGSR